jgi:23S rRNA pseudouridine2605 synthase
MRAKPPRFGAARVISKLGLGSRTQGAQWVREGRVRVNGRLIKDPEFPVDQAADLISVDGEQASQPQLVIMLNKPRGLVTTTRDEQGRDTVYRCLEGAGLPWLAPVGRLDKASEGLLLFSNDSKWAAQMTNPATGPDKTYHVQIDRIADEALAAKLARGTTVDGELLCARRVRCLRQGQKYAWMEIVLDEGRNRQIRRLLGAFDIAVLRLVRISVGDLQLGDLPKGAWRIVTQREIESLAPSRR